MQNVIIAVLTTVVTLFALLWLTGNVRIVTVQPYAKHSADTFFQGAGPRDRRCKPCREGASHSPRPGYPCGCQ